MAATLDSVIVQLKSNNKEQEQTTRGVQNQNKLLLAFIADQKFQRTKDLENQREMMNKLTGSLGMMGGTTKKSTSDGKTKSGGFTMPDWMKGALGGLGLAGLVAGVGRILKILRFLGAGLVALELASLGFKGWEAGALKKLTALSGKGLNSIGAKIGGLIDDTVRAGLKFIGISEDVMGTSKAGNPYLKMRQGADGKFLGKELASTKEMMKRLFGMGDGTDPKKAQAGMFAKIRDIIGRLFSPLVKFIDSAADIGKTFFTPFAAVGKFLGVTTLAGLSALGITKFAPLVGKILWPLGILFSAFEAVTSWTDDPENADRSTDEKVMNVISTFIGNFVGAPLDLLKKGVTWLFKKAFGLETDKDGKIIPGQGIAGKMGEYLQNFSFEEFIKDFFNGHYAIVKAVFTEIVSFIKNPKQYVKDAYEKILNDNGVDSMSALIKKKATDLFDSLFGWIPSLEDLKAGFKSVARAIVPDFLHSTFGLESDEDLAQQEMDAKNEANKPTRRQRTLLKIMGRMDKDGDLKDVSDGHISLAELEKYVDITDGKYTFKPGVRGPKFATFVGEMMPEIARKHDMDTIVAAITQAMEGGRGLNYQNVVSEGDTSVLAVTGSTDTINVSDLFLDKQN